MLKGKKFLSMITSWKSKKVDKGKLGKDDAASGEPATGSLGGDADADSIASRLGLGRGRDGGEAERRSRNSEVRGYGNNEDRGYGDRGYGNNWDRGYGNNENRNFGNNEDPGYGNSENRQYWNIEKPRYENNEDRGYGQDRCWSDAYAGDSWADDENEIAAEESEEETIPKRPLDDGGSEDSSLKRTIPEENEENVSKRDRDPTDRVMKGSTSQVTAGKIDAVGEGFSGAGSCATFEEWLRRTQSVRPEEEQETRATKPKRSRHRRTRKRKKAIILEPCPFIIIPNHVEG